MGIFVRRAIVVVILLAAYWGWALAGTAQLASAASRGDSDGVMERIDLQPLIRSLSGQISQAYLNENPNLKNPQSPHPSLALNASAAEMLLRALLTPEHIAMLLHQGRGGGLN